MQNFILSLLSVQSSYRQLVQSKIKESGIYLSFEMLQVLRILYFKEGISQQELADQLSKDKSNVSYLLSSMEKRNIIKRQENDIDKRSKLIVLTTEGQSMQKQIKDVIDTVNNKIEDLADETKLMLTTQYMKRINDIITMNNTV